MTVMAPAANSPPTAPSTTDCELGTADTVVMSRSVLVGHTIDWNLEIADTVVMSRSVLVGHAIDWDLETADVVISVVVCNTESDCVLRTADDIRSVIVGF